MRILIWHYSPPDPNSAFWFWLKGGMEVIGHQVEPWLLTRLRERGIAVIVLRFDDGMLAAPGSVRQPDDDWRRLRLYDAVSDLAVTICRGMVTDGMARPRTTCQSPMDGNWLRPIPGRRGLCAGAWRKSRGWTWPSYTGVIGRSTR